MKAVRHLLWVAKMRIKAITCKHTDFEVLSCPFTKLTYTTCTSCLTRMKVEKTIEQP